jgi:hypothetical protein
MKYWFKTSGYQSDPEFLNSLGKLKTDKVKKSSIEKANKISRFLSQSTGFTPLKPYWTTKSTFGWVFCDFPPIKKGSSLIGTGSQKLFELIKDEYKYAILSQYLDENISEQNISEDKVIIINITFFKEFVKTFSNPSKRSELFLYRLPDEQLEIIKRWMRGRPADLKNEDKKIISSDVLQVIKDNKELFKSKSTVSLILNNVKEYFISQNINSMNEAVEKLKNMMDDSKTTEMEINKHLLENPWIISFDYASLETKKDENFDVHIIRKKWDIEKDVLVELKTPTKKTKTTYSTHEVISAETAKAISQCINYLEDNKELFDRGIVILGRGEPESLDKMNKYLHNIQILTYDQIYKKAKRVLDFLSSECKKEVIETEEVKNETP